MKNFKDIICMVWIFTSLAFLILIFVCVFVPEISKQELSLSLLGLVVSVLTTIAIMD